MEGTQTVNELEAILYALSPLDTVADNWYRALIYVCKMLMNCLSVNYKIQSFEKAYKMASGKL